ncbi:phage tail protein [Methylomonas sp. SURF-2]|uniref:Phage tail protein n=1 Tax=Methylomonas subterranea TaxID=2952225 RepID=A0ABT1TF65_9GAMM|nr:phage tail protein [Methylomonas sp. SURF-2]MCQ8103712.1 phage tail protein [Methylomonas sp. SURF-2]
MDSNRSSFLVLKTAGDFTSRSLKFVWDGRQQAFRLEQQQAHFFPRPTPEQALSAWTNAPARVMDKHGQIGAIGADGKRFQVKADWQSSQWRDVRASSDNPDAQTIDQLSLAPVLAPDFSRFVDLHVGGGSLVALAASGAENALVAMDLQRRWQQRCALDFVPERLCVDSRRRVWLAGRYTDADGNPQAAIAMAQGEPLPQPYHPPALGFYPLSANPQALQQQWRRDAEFYDGLLAMCVDADYLYLLVYRQTAGAYRQHLLIRALSDDADQPLLEVALPEELPFAVDCSAVAPRRLALLVPKPPQTGQGQWDCPVVILDSRQGTARLDGERYRMLSLESPRFMVGLDGKTRYQSAQGPMPLLPLPQARFPRNGVCILDKPLDAGTPDLLWHRLYLEACIPAGCGLRLYARAYDETDGKSAAEWQLQPEPLWLPQASELPFYAGWKTPQQPYQGLYQILLQRRSGACRELRGRFLQLKLQMDGDGRHTPAIHAIRVHMPRFSWQQHYLPRHFQQQERPLEGDLRPANGADFRERLLAAFEGQLTPIEDRIGAGEMLIDPQSAPAEQLQTLAGMLGVELPEHWPMRRQRDWLSFSGQLQRQRGTMAGLCLALDIATDGGVSRGQVIPVEHFRLRRTLATILGLDLSDDRHPLTLGTGQSGNSIVGDSLILSADNAREFLALLAPDLIRDSADDRRVVAEFFDRYSHRLSVILHGPAAEQRNGVEQILRRQLPAHLQWAVRTSDYAFVPGLSPLLQIDSYLQRTPAWKKLILDRIRLGRDGLLQNPIALAPELATAPETENSGD